MLNIQKRLSFSLWKWTKSKGRLSNLSIWNIANDRASFILLLSRNEWIRPFPEPAEIMLKIVVVYDFKWTFYNLPGISPTWTLLPSSLVRRPLIISWKRPSPDILIAASKSSKFSFLPISIAWPRCVVFINLCLMLASISNWRNWS